MKKNYKSPYKFPAEITGTWTRAFDSPHANTLTFTPNALVSSSQSSHWILVDVSDDTYTLLQSDNQYHCVKETIRYADGNLEISEESTYLLNSRENWNGFWKKHKTPRLSFNVSNLVTAPGACY